MEKEGIRPVVDRYSAWIESFGPSSNCVCESWAGGDTLEHSPQEFRGRTVQTLAADVSSQQKYPLFGVPLLECKQAPNRVVQRPGRCRRITRDTRTEID